jgi:hypothetical protein
MTWTTLCLITLSARNSFSLDVLVCSKNPAFYDEDKSLIAETRRLMLRSSSRLMEVLSDLFSRDAVSCASRHTMRGIQELH